LEQEVAVELGADVLEQRLERLCITQHNVCATEDCDYDEGGHK
jgi:hypothetical protein